MDHFTLGDWVDFIRKLKSSPVEMAMQKHLDEGCQQCLRVVRMWQHLAAFSAQERSSSPPERALRSVRGYYGLLKPRKQRSRIAVMGQLLFDSFLEAVPAGIRSSQSAPRQLLYAAEQVVIDLRIEHTSGHVHIVGQAQPRSLRDPELAGNQVLALRDGKAVAQTRLNRFGEFQFNLETEDDDEFSIVLRAPLSVVVRLRSVGALQGGASES